MEIRRAEKRDINEINKLLHQVLDVHRKGRPDIFKADAKKYTDEQLLEMIEDDTKPIFVGIEGNKVAGYCFCVIQQSINNNILTDIKTLYIDDICVDEKKRGIGIGRRLYEHALSFAKEQGCYNLTLNVWSCNKEAMDFYKKMGLVPQKTQLEKVLK